MENYVCAGDPLVATYDQGPVDADGLPNTIYGTLPGSFVVLQWRDLKLQLPRTNIAKAPIYSDNKWMWILEDPQQPLLLLNQGGTSQYDCVQP